MIILTFGFLEVPLNNKMKDSVTRKDGYYHFNEGIKKNFININDEFKTISSSQNKILDDLLVFIEAKENKTLSEADKKNVFESFNHFLMDTGSYDKYSNHISTFIIINEEKQGFKANLNTIKEGVILYQGIRYTADINELGKWNTDLTIYLNTEHLFNALGYNGILFQEIFNDFYKLVNEINYGNKKPNQRKKIELKYFEETKIEVDNYFLTAESIKKGLKLLDPSKPAMKKILDSTKSLSDIKALRVKFDIELKKIGIDFQEFNHNLSNKMSYNVEDINSIEALRKESIDRRKHFNENDCHQYFNIFTKINIFRNGESTKPFERIGHLFITENGFAKYLAHNNNVKFGENDVPFAKDIDYITTKFWFKLKKGFSEKQNLPKSFDVATKAKIILSSHLNNSISQGYYHLQEEVKNGKLSKDEALQRSYEFRIRPNKPEEINVNNVDSSFNFLNNETYFEDLHREKERKEMLLAETQTKNEELQRELDRRNEIEKERERREIEIAKVKELELNKQDYDKRKEENIITTLSNLKVV